MTAAPSTQGDEPAGAGPGTTDPDVRGPAPRRSLLLQGVGAALVAGGLALVSLPGPVALLVGIAALQLVLVLGVLVLLDAPSGRAAFAIAVAAAAVGDTLVLTTDGTADALAGVLALSLVAALILQIARRDRSRVTESLADTLLVALLVTSSACLIALRDLPGGREAVLVALAAAGTALLVGRAVDLVSAAPRLVPEATRGWPGLLVGLGAGVLAATVLAAAGSTFSGSRGALIGLAVAATAVCADLAVDLAALELRAGRRDARRVLALGPVGWLLPYAALAPVCLLATTLVLTSR